MTVTSNGASDIRPGRNAPSGVRRVLILGYYDGATDGVIELSPLGEVYQFRLVGDFAGPEGADRRTFLLAPLPTGSMDRLEGVIGPHIKPRWPAWAPVWRFPDETTRLGVEAEVDAILAAAGPPAWRVETDEYWTFKDFTATPVVDEPAAHG